MVFYSDIAALIIAFISVKMAPKSWTKVRTDVVQLNARKLSNHEVTAHPGCCLVILLFQNTYGWARAEVLGALVNAVFLVALCFSITVESLKRFYEPEDIHDPQERHMYRTYQLQ